MINPSLSHKEYPLSEISFYEEFKAIINPSLYVFSLNQNIVTIYHILWIFCHD